LALTEGSKFLGFFGPAANMNKLKTLIDVASSTTSQLASTTQSIAHSVSSSVAKQLSADANNPNIGRHVRLGDMTIKLKAQIAEGKFFFFFKQKGGLFTIYLFFTSSIFHQMFFFFFVVYS
jgi:hypothetical protein